MENWIEKKDNLLEKRFEFNRYSDTSRFLDDIQGLSKSKNIYPNISFGKNFVSISIQIDLDLDHRDKKLKPKEKIFAEDIDSIYESI